jgi:hypothetical protein
MAGLGTLIDACIAFSGKNVKLAVVPASALLRPNCLFKNLRATGSKIRCSIVLARKGAIGRSNDGE